MKQQPIQNVLWMCFGSKKKENKKFLLELWYTKNEDARIKDSRTKFLINNKDASFNKVAEQMKKIK